LPWRLIGLLGEVGNGTEGRKMHRRSPLESQKNAIEESPGTRFGDGVTVRYALPWVALVIVEDTVKGAVAKSLIAGEEGRAQ